MNGKKNEFDIHLTLQNIDNTLICGHQILSSEWSWAMYSLAMWTFVHCWRPLGVIYV